MLDFSYPNEIVNAALREAHEFLPKLDAWDATPAARRRISFAQNSRRGRLQARRSDTTQSLPGGSRPSRKA